MRNSLRIQRLLCLTVVLACLAPGKATGGGEPIVAVFDIEDMGSKLKPRVLDVLTEYLSARLTEGGVPGDPPGPDQGAACGQEARELQRMLRAKLPDRAGP